MVRRPPHRPSYEELVDENNRLHQEITRLRQLVAATTPTTTTTSTSSATTGTTPSTSKGPGGGGQYEREKEEAPPLPQPGDEGNEPLLPLPPSSSLPSTSAAAKAVDSSDHYRGQLSAPDIRRYSRQLLVSSLSVRGQQALLSSSVLVIGAGE